MLHGSLIYHTIFLYFSRFKFIALKYFELKTFICIIILSTQFWNQVGSQNTPQFLPKINTRLRGYFTGLMDKNKHAVTRLLYWFYGQNRTLIQECCNFKFRYPQEFPNLGSQCILKNIVLKTGYNWEWPQKV